MTGPHPLAKASSDLVREHSSLGITEKPLLALSQSQTPGPAPPERWAVITSPEGWPAPVSVPHRKPQQKQQSPRVRESGHQDQALCGAVWNLWT